MTARLRVAVTLEQCWHEVPGGTARAAVDLSAALLRRGEVDLVGVSARHSSDPPEAYRPPVPVRRSPLPRLALYEGWHRLRWPSVESIAGEVDVVHATGIAFPAARAPVVTTLHDLAFLRLPEAYTRRGNAFFRRALELTRRHAAVVCCSSMQTLEDCVGAGIDRDRLRHVPLGVSAPTVTAADRERVRARYSLQRPYLLWTGTREPRKNLSRLLAAYGAITDPGADLVLVGPAGWHTDRTGTEGDLPRGVRTLGFVPGSDLAALYAECEVFCFPSLLEGFGLPVLEAMAQGAPVVTSRGTSTEELAGDAAVLVDPTDVDELTEAISVLLGDEQRRRELGRLGPARAALYSWDATAQLTGQLYAEVAGG